MPRKLKTIVHIRRYIPIKEEFGDEIEFELEDAPDLQVQDLLFLPIFLGDGFKITGRRWDKKKEGNSLTLFFEERVPISDCVWDGMKALAYRTGKVIYLPKQKW